MPDALAPQLMLIFVPEPVTVPMPAGVVYGWANEVNKPGEITGLTFEQLNSAAIVVLLVMVLALNAAAILLRNRFERNRQG